MAKLVTEISPDIKLLFTDTPIPAYENYIGTYLCTGSKNAIIDPGPKRAIPGLIAALNEAGLQPGQIDYIILTHIHIDHAGGSGTAMKQMKNARLVVHERGVKHMIDPTALTKGSIDTLGDLVAKYGEIEPVAADRIITAEDGMFLDMGRSQLQLVSTPGHAAHHQCVFENNGRVLFSGDAVGVMTSGLLRLTTPPPFRFKTTLESLDKITALEPLIICYGHLGGYDNAAGRLNAFRSLLTHWYEYAQAEAKLGKTVTEVLNSLIDKELDLRAYYAKLTEDERKRDNLSLSNSVTGLMTAFS